LPSDANGAEHVSTRPPEGIEYAPVASRSWPRTALRLAGPVLLIILIARLDDPLALLRSLRDALGWEVVVVIALNGLTIHTKVLRWCVLLRARGIDFPLRRAWMSFLASSYVGMLTPGRVGDVVRIQYLRKERGAPYAEGLASVVVDRLCDLYVLGAFVAIAAVRFRAVIAGELAVFTWVTLAAAILGPLFLWVPGFAERAFGAIYRRVAKGAGSSDVELFLDAVRSSVSRRLFVTVPLTLAAYLLSTLQGWLLARAVGATLPFFDIACLLAIANLLGLLPISISGLGVRELLYSLIFPLFGYAASVGVTFGLLIFGTLYMFIVLLGFVAWQVDPPPVGAAPKGSPFEHRTG
jgi:glycosyltransferase 2 family protein